MSHALNDTTAVGAPGEEAGRELPQLSCDLCRERKVKCDKGDPCTGCVQAGVPCETIYRHRLPRGRYASRSGRALASSSSTSTQASRRKNSTPTAAAAQGTTTKELQERIRRLEGFIVTQAGLSMSPTPETNPGASSSQRPTSANTTPDSNLSLATTDVTSPPLYYGSLSPLFPKSLSQTSLPGRPDAFWADFLGETQGGRGGGPSGVPKDDFVLPLPDFGRQAPADGGMSVLGLCGSSSAQNTLPPGFVTHNRPLATQLCQVYFTQVDPIIKILHRPSVERWMTQGQAYLQYPNGHSSVRALETAICYSAVSSMTESQCQATFHAPKPAMADAFCKMSEAALQTANLLNTRDLTGLQAFMLYLMGRKCQHPSMAIWTLISVAVRIGENLGLHKDPEVDCGPRETFFTQQMRKRLWLTISLLDFDTASAHGSRPLVRHEDLCAAVSQIRHINDTDFDMTSTDPVPDREELTDMTFSYVLYQLQLAGRLLAFTEPSAAATSQMCALRKEHVRVFEEKALGVLRFCDPESSPFAWRTWHSTQCLVAAMRASLLRPTPPAQQATRSPSDASESNPELLRLTLRVIEKVQLMYMDQRGDAFRWYAFVPWQTLVTALEQYTLCDDLALLQRGWPVLEWSFHQQDAVFTQLGEEARQSSLRKVMQRAQAKMAGIQHRNASGQQSPMFGSVLPTPLSTPGSAPGEMLFDPSWMPTGSDPCSLSSSLEGTSQPFRRASFEQSPFLQDLSMMGDMSSSRTSGYPFHMPDAMDTSGRMPNGNGYMMMGDVSGSSGMFF